MKDRFMKFGVVIILSLLASGCSLFYGQQPVMQESYMVPVIRSDVSSSGYTPSVTPMITTQESPRIYTPVIR